MSVLCIPAECDNIKLPIECEIASRWDAYLLCDICRHFASVMLHFASLITHNLRCIPAYTHQIPMGFSSVITHVARLVSENQHQTPTGFSSAIIIMPQMECAPLTSLISKLNLTSNL